MTFVLDALRDKPQGIFQMDDTSPLQDYSGYNRTGVINGTPDKHIALVKGATYAPVLTNDITGEFSSNVFRQGSESDDFTLAATISAVLKSVGNLAQTYRENLISNPSMETIGGSASTDWVPITSTGTLVPSIVSGTNAIQISGGTAGASRLERAVEFLSAGTYTLSIYHKVTATSGIAPSSSWLQVSRVDGGGTLVSLTNPVTTSTLNTVYRNSVTFTVPDEGAPINLRFRCYTGGYTVVFDGAQLESGSVATSYFDGATVGYEWAGTANASISKARTEVSKVNYAIDPTLESTTALTGSANPGSSTDATRYPVELATDYIHSGTHSRKSTRIGTNSTVISSIYILPASGTRTFLTKPGEVFSVGCWVRASLDCRARIHGNFRDQTLTNIGTTLDGGYISLTANTWTWVTFNNLVAPDNTYLFYGYVNVYTNAGNTVGGESVWMDSVQVTKGPVADNFFYGDTSGAAWTGSVNNSASILYVSQTEQQILGNQNQMDGLTTNGTEVSFVTKYSTAPEARCSFDLQYVQSARCWGVHTESKNLLYVNGELVDEVTLTEEQKSDTFVTTSSNLFSGATDSSQGVAINAVAFYSYALSGPTIARQNRAALAVPSPEAIANIFGGTETPITDDYADIFLNQSWSESSDWNLGLLSNVVVANDLIVPQFSEDASIAGYWYDSIAIDAAESSSIYGVVVNWNGVGVNMEVSLDGATWHSVTRGKKVDLITPGYNPTDKVLSIRAGFQGGIVDDESFLESLNVVGFLSDVTNLVNGRTVTLVNSTPNKNHAPLEFHDNWGVRVDSGGSLTISSDIASDGEDISTIEVWVKPSATTTASFGTTSSATYQNGVVGSDSLIANKWVVYHRVLTTPLTGSLVLDVPGQIGRAVLYPTALTAQQVADIYAAHMGTNFARVTDSSVIGITESATAVDIYAYDWSITGAG